MTALINKFVAWLRSPYPELRQRWKTVVLPSLLVFFILYFLQPFGISRMEENRFLVLSGYALVSMAMLAVVVYVFPVLFPAWHREERWTLGKELLATLLMCVLVTLGNWCYTAWTFQLDLDLRLLYICLLWMLLFNHRQRMQAVGNVPALPWISFFYLIVAFFQQFSVEKPRPFFLILPVVKTLKIGKCYRHVCRIIYVFVMKNRSFLQRMHRTAIQRLFLLRLIKGRQKKRKKCHVKIKGKPRHLSISVL